MKRPILMPSANARTVHGRLPLSSRWTGTFTAAVALAVTAFSWWTQSSLRCSAGVAAFLYFLCYLPGRYLFRLSFNEEDESIAVCTVLGWALLAVVARVCASLWLPPEAAAVLAACLAVTVLRQPELRSPPLVLPRYSVPLVGTTLVVAVALATSVYGCLLSGRGEVAPCFFHVDSSYFLAQTQALARYNEFPPPDLAFFDTRLGYHYGTPLMAALLVRLTDLRAHSAMFLVLLPVLLCAKVALTVSLARTCAPQIPRFLAVALLLFLKPLPGSIIWATKCLVRGMVPGPFVQVVFSPDSFERFFPVSTGLYAEIATMLVLLTALRDRCRTPQFWLLAFVVGTLPLFKSTQFLVLGTGLGAAAVSRWLFFRERTLIWCCIMSVGLAILLLKLPSAPMGADVQFAAGRYVSMVTTEVGQMSLAWVPLLVLLFTRGAPGYPLAFLGSFLSVQFALTASVVVMFHMKPGEPPVETPHNTVQLLSAAPLCLAVLLLLILGRHWATLGFARRRAVVWLLGLMMALPVLSALVNVVRMGYNPSLGHSFVDNGPLAEVLRAATPAADTLLVTNEWHYPSDGGVRDLHQFQIPALYGHPCFGAGFVYGESRHGQARQRLQLQMELRDSVSPATIRRAARLRWTHFLVDKSAPHPAKIPLPLLKENDRYALYRFSSPTSTDHLSQPEQR